MTFTSNNLSSLLYLILVLLILLFLFFLSNKKYLNRNLQSLSIWGLIFFGAMACYYIWDDIQINIKNNKESIQLISNDTIIIGKKTDGHFYLTIEINNHPITFLVDTGATRTILSKNDMLVLLKTVSYLPTEKKLETANGIIVANEITVSKIEVYGNPIEPSNLLVVSEGFQGPKVSLLGLDLLNKFKNFEISKRFLKIQVK